MSNKYLFIKARVQLKTNTKNMIKKEYVEMMNFNTECVINKLSWYYVGLFVDDDSIFKYLNDFNKYYEGNMECSFEFPDNNKYFLTTTPEANFQFYMYKILSSDELKFEPILNEFCHTPNLSSDINYLNYYFGKIQMRNYRKTKVMYNSSIAELNIYGTDIQIVDNLNNIESSVLTLNIYNPDPIHFKKEVDNLPSGLQTINFITNPKINQSVINQYPKYYITNDIITLLIKTYFKKLPINLKIVFHDLEGNKQDIYV